MLAEWGCLAEQQFAMNGSRRGGRATLQADRAHRRRAPWRPAAPSAYVDGEARCLQKLKMASHVQHVIDEITDDIERRTETESGIVGSERKPPSSVLCLGLQDAGLRPRYAYHLYCAY